MKFSFTKNNILRSVNVLVFSIGKEWGVEKTVAETKNSLSVCKVGTLSHIYLIELLKPLRVNIASTFQMKQ